MTQPPRRIEPLSPPPGAFDEVRARAHARRYRRLSAGTGVAAVFLAGITGGLAMGGGVSGVQTALSDLTGQLNPVAHGTATTTTVPSATDRPRSSRSPSARQQPHRAVPSHAIGTGAAAAMVRGRVVDPAGSPVAGMYVYGGTIAAGAFVPGSVAAGVTDAQGRYAVPCTGGPVLLTSWRLNTPLGATATGRWAPTYLAAPLCSRVTAYPRTTVFAGATIQGHVTTDAVCPTQEFSLQLWIGGDPASTVLLTDVEAGDTYRIPGLPPGSHVLHAQGQQTTIEVPATTVHDVTFACSAVSPPTDDPTASPSPHPTPSETGAPPPPTDTSSPMPTATSTSTGH